ncbi:MAG TPA: phenylacetate--CoA ligase family protein [Stellaceae bacterium]|nr:phenylacetate--CoA ligase family protein [Stellaceae bacterium]
MAASHYDELENRNPAAREAALLAALPKQIAHAQAKAPYYAATLKGIDPREIASRKALADLPVTRKSELIALQQQQPPFAGLNAVPRGELARIFMSPGPIYEPEARAPDFWRMARALYAAGFRKGQLVHNSFSYHLTPAGAMLEAAAQVLGCAVMPGGVGQTELQLRAIADLKPDGYVGTPSFLKILVDKARESGTAISSLKRALVSGEAFLKPAQAEISSAGIDAYQCYATAELGLIAYESPAREGLILAEDIIVELLRSGTGDPVAADEIGEVTVTLLSPEYPLIRFATGDLSTLLPGQSPCGRSNARIKGWLGRADQTAKVKGLFVHPAQIADIVKRHPGLTRARLVIEQGVAGDVLTLEAESASPDAALESGLVESLAAITRLRGRIRLVAPGQLPKDGKIIEDRRKAP